ncbi:hypothetical protein ACLEEB_02735 [Lonsdalea quercina]|uniref:hypothetical protein n=1 Tax=Lonsdalea quercina TaxID=71657 RepID=UPI00397687D3
MSAPFNVRARCGLPQHRCAAGRRGWHSGAAWRTGLRPLLSASYSFFSIHGVAAVPGGAGTGVSPQANVNINPEREVGLTASAEGRHLAPAPTPLRWLRPARSRRLLARCRARHLSPVRPPPGASLLNIFAYGLRQPAPGRRFAVPQASCGTARAAPTPTGKTTNGSGRRRCYDVAVAGGKVTAGR